MDDTEFFGIDNTVSIFSVGVKLEGKNQFFDTNRKDRNCILKVISVDC